MPDRPQVYAQYADQNSKLIENDSYKVKRNKPADGVKPTNDASPNNPFNTMAPEEYDQWRAANQEFQGQFARKRDGQLNKEGNYTSDDNPMLFRPLGLNTLRYGEQQPKFTPPVANDDRLDRRFMENNTRQYLTDVYGVDFNKPKQ